MNAPVDVRGTRVKRVVLEACIFLSPILILIALAISHRKTISAARSHYGTREQFKAWAAQDIDSWAAKKYISLDDRSSVKTALSRIQIGGNSLTPVMRDGYVSALMDFLYAYRDGGPDNWRAFRLTKENLSHELTPKGAWETKLYYSLIKTQAVPGILPRDKKFIQSWVQRYLTSSPPQVNGPNDLERLFFDCVKETTYGKFYNDYFEGVCLDEAIAEHAVYTSNPKPLNEQPFFHFEVQRGYSADANFPNQGYWYWANGVQNLSYLTVHPTLPELLAKAGRVDCMNAFIYVQINETGKVTPILLRHVWNPDIHQWMIAELVDGNLLGNRVTRLFL
jgi:hypothetical protein